ncbi:MAG: hypothetical protein EOP48_25690, partial [Sphingobacteriales bacterium]
MHSYPWNSPYSYAEGDPINFLDIDGLEKSTSQAQATAIPAAPITKVVIDQTIKNGAKKMAEEAAVRGGGAVVEEAAKNKARTGIGAGLSKGLGLFIGFLLTPLDAGHSCPCGKGHDLASQCPKSSLYKETPSPTPEKKPQIVDPRTTKPLDEDDNEGAHLYKTLDNQKNTGTGGLGLVANDMAHPIPYIGITTDKLIGGRYSSLSLRGANSQIIGTGEFSTIAGAESAIIALNTYGLKYKLKIPTLSSVDVRNSTRVGNLKFSYKNEQWINRGILWLNKIRPGWDKSGDPNSLLFPENKPGAN